MKINILKAISIVVCCFVASLWSETQSMDNQPDVFESATVNRTAYMQSSSQNWSDSLNLVSTPSQIINLEHSSTSWVYYLISPIKSTIRMAYDVMNFTAQNPQKAMIISLLVASNIASAAALNCTGCAVCQCYCTERNFIRNMGIAPNILDCIKVCNITGIPFNLCKAI